MNKKPNDQAERLAVNARKPETKMTEPTQTAEPQAGSQFAPATLLGDCLSSTDFSSVSQECREWHRQGISVDVLSRAESQWDSLQKPFDKQPTQTLESLRAQVASFSRMGLVLQTVGLS